MPRSAASPATALTADQVGPGDLAEGRLHRGPEGGFDLELLVQPPAADPARGAGDPACLLLGQAGANRIEPAAQCGGSRTGRRGRFPRCPGGAIGAVGGVAGQLAIGNRSAFALARSRGRVRRSGPARLQLDSFRDRPVGVRPLLDGATFGLHEPPPRGLQFGQPRGLGAAHGGQLFAPALADRAHGADLLERLGQSALGLGHGRLELGLGSGYRRRGFTPAQGEVRFRRDPLGLEPLPVAADGGQVRGETRLAELELGVGRSRDLMGFAADPLGLGPCPECRGQDRRSRFGLGQLAGDAVGLGPGAAQPVGRDDVPGRRLVPAAVRGGHQRGREVVAGGGPGDLLFGLRGETPGLRSELGQDVVHPGEVDLGFGELLLGLPPATLVAAHAGDLLEQRPAFLGSEGQGLVDHALADEQEGVVGEMRRIEQVDQVAQADPLLVEQVVVLPERYSRRPSSRTPYSTGSRPSALSRTSVTSAMPRAARRSDPAKITSSLLRLRSARPCSPRAQRRASARLLLPEPLGPTTALIPGPNSTIVRSAKDLKPWSRSASRRAGALTREPSRAGRGRAASAAAISAALLGAALPRAEGPAADRHLDPKQLVVVGPARVDEPVGRSLAVGSLGVLLEPALGALQAREGRVARQLRLGLLEEPVADHVVAEVEVDRPDQGLEARGEERDPRPPVAARFAFAETKRLTELDPAGDPGQTLGADDGRPAGRQDTLVVVRAETEERLADDQGDDGVTQELEALVVAGDGLAVLVQVTAVGQGLLEQVEVADRKPQACREPIGRTHQGAGGSPARRRARRCIRRHRRRCGSSPHPRR